MSRQQKIKEIEQLLKPTGNYLYGHIVPDGKGGIHWQMASRINNPQVHDDLIVESCANKSDAEFFRTNRQLVAEAVEAKRKEIYSH